jgi:predicted NBD/HSP70 family sugar kinase
VTGNKGGPLANNQIANLGIKRRGVAAEELRRHNLSTVLDRLHLAGALSRSHLAEHTGLNRSTIGDLIGELANAGLVAEDIGTTGNGRGRPSLIARPRPAGAVVLAVELEVDSMTVATVGLGSHIFHRTRTVRSSATASPEIILDDLAEQGSELIRALPRDHTLVGIGVAVAGVVRREDGFVHVAPNLGWTNVSLGAMIEDRLSLPVMMANEADLGALAEFRRGSGQGQRHLIYVAGEVGVGIGIIHDGKPMLGAAGYAGEAGHMVINPQGRQCRCGNIGCWETEVGQETLAELAGFSETDSSSELIASILESAHQGDPTVFEAFNEVGRWLGIGIGNLINTFNPDVVVAGGLFGQLYPFLEQPMLKNAQQVALDAPWMSCEIRQSKLGVDAHIIGAAELVLAEIIADPGRTLTSADVVDGESAPTTATESRSY